MAYRTIEVCLSEFSDEEIIDEVRDRQLQGRVHLPSDSEGEEINVQQLAGDVQSLLMTRQHDKAKVAIEKLLAAMVPPSIVAAFGAVRDGRFDEAICELDDFIQPPPSATAAALPKPRDEARA